MTRILFALLLLVPLLSGCVTPSAGEPPRLLITPAEADVPLDGTLEILVRFVNTAEEHFTAESRSGCLDIRVWVRVGEQSVLLDDATERDCTDAAGQVSVAPGESQDWGPFTLNPDEYRTPSGPLFEAGKYYPLIADVHGTDRAWPVKAETRVGILPPEGDNGLKIEVHGQEKAFTAGETNAIHAWFTNTLDVPYNYTSRDGCNDIHVWVEIGEGEDGWLRLYPDMEPYACTQAITEFTVAPGGTIRTTVHWDGSKSGRGGPPYVDQAPYFVTARLDGQEDLPTGRGGVFVFEAGS